MSGQRDDSPRFPPDDLKVEAVTAGANPKRIADFRRQEEERREQQMRERAEQARQDALAQFAPRRNGEYVCPSCAAVVTDPERHLDWHGALAAIAAEAREAAWRGRPIG